MTARCVAPGREAWFFACSDCGDGRAAFVHALIATAMHRGSDLQLWLANMLARIADMPTSRLEGLLPWKWTAIELAA